MLFVVVELEVVCSTGKEVAAAKKLIGFGIDEKSQGVWVDDAASGAVGPKGERPELLRVLIDGFEIN